MSSDRLLADLPSAEVAAERTRVQDLIGEVMDATIDRCMAADHPVARQLLRDFAGELGRLRKFTREGGTLEEFVEHRNRKEADRAT